MLRNAATQMALHTHIKGTRGQEAPPSIFWQPGVGLLIFLVLISIAISIASALSNYPETKERLSTLGEGWNRQAVIAVVMLVLSLSIFRPLRFILRTRFVGVAMYFGLTLWLVLLLSRLL